MRRLTAVISTCWGLACEAQQSTPAPPDIVSWRYSENYSYLADPANRTGAWWERGKWIELGPDSALTVGAELRVRHEHYRNNLFGDSPVSNDGYTLYRLLPYANLKLGTHLRAFAQLNLTHANRDGRSLAPVDDTGNEWLQGFVDLSFNAGSGELNLRGGRRVMAYGSERLISARYGPNVLRSFEGGTLNWHNPKLRVDTMLLRPLRHDQDTFSDRSDRRRRLWGIYATVTAPGNMTGTGLDLYYLGASNTNAQYQQGTGAETRNTLGVRWFGKRDNWNWDLEGFYQYGNFAGARINAWSVATDVRYTFKDVRLTPQLELKANLITGDRNPDDPRLQTFNPLFPKGKYFGEAGVIGPVNLINLHASFNLDLGNGWSLGTAAIFYWRHSLHDGIYDVAGSLIRATGNSRERYIGTQTDLSLGWQISRQLSVEAAYSLLMPGAFIKDSGRHKTIHFTGLQALWRY